MFKTRKEQLYCDYKNTDIIITSISKKVADKDIVYKKRCSDWSNCENRAYCKYGKK